jgi:hypothetical protein
VTSFCAHCWQYRVRLRCFLRGFGKKYDIPGDICSPHRWHFQGRRPRVDSVGLTGRGGGSGSVGTSSNGGKRTSGRAFKNNRSGRKPRYNPTTNRPNPKVYAVSYGLSRCAAPGGLREYADTEVPSERVYALTKTVAGVNVCPRSYHYSNPENSHNKASHKPRVQPR